MPKKKPEKVVEEKLLNPILLKLLGIAAIIYILLWAIISSLIGTSIATVITTPLLAISLFAITRWDRTRTSDNFQLNQLVSVPKLNYWNILCIVLSIFIIGQVFSLPIIIYVFKTDSHSIISANSFSDFFSVLIGTWQTAVLLLLATYISYSFGGFLAAWLPNKKCYSPYRHAVVGSLIYGLLTITIVAITFIWSAEEDPPSQNAAGFILLAVTPTFIFSLFGVWLSLNLKRIPVGKPLPVNTESDSKNVESATEIQTITQTTLTSDNKEKIISKRKRRKNLSEDVVKRENSKPNRITLRRSITIIFVCIVLSAYIGGLTWVITIPEPVECPDPPNTATLNFWPVTYANPAEFCHDYPSVDARVVDDQTHYSKSQEEWERGLTVRAGDQIYVVIYINNGAADNAESISPDWGIAHNIQLTTGITEESASIKYINVQFAGDNTNIVNNRFKITTGTDEWLEIVSKSGEVFGYRGKPLRKNFDIENRTIIIGDLPPSFNNSLFIRYKVKVHSDFE